MTSPNYTPLSIIYGITAVFGCILNLIIIITIVRVKSFRGRRANLFLGSLCLSDLFTCGYSVTYHLVHLHPEIYSAYISTTYCRVTQYFIYVLAFSSTLCLSVVCIDRYLAITKPFLYLSNTFWKISSILLVWPWIQSLTTSIPAISTPQIEVSNSSDGFPCGFKSSWETLQVFMVLIPINIVLPFICIVFSCIIVFRVARTQLRRIQTQVPAQLEVTSMEGTSNGTPDTTYAASVSLSKNGDLKLQRDFIRRRFQSNLREETRITFATLAVVIGFLVAWAPYLVTRSLYLIGYNLPNSWYVFGTAFVLANSAWNPVLVLSFRRDMRRSVFPFC